MPEGTYDNSSVNLTPIENALKDISDNLGSGDEKLFVECALRLFANCNFDDRISEVSPQQLITRCIQNALLFVNSINKAKAKYFKH